MESPRKKYKTLLNINNIKDIAYDVLYTRYITKNLKGEDKVLDIDSTDQEGLVRKLNGGYPLPGFIYTFIYPPKDEIIQIGDKEYTDYVPIVFCTSVKGMLFKGVNLNTLPNLERVKFLEVYWMAYKNFFKDIEVKTQNDELALNMKFISLMSSPLANKILDVMSRMTNANFSYGFRTYDAKKIRQLRMIEYTEWDYIPFFEPRNAFKGMNQKQINDAYWKTR